MKNLRKHFVRAIKNALQCEKTILVRSASIDLILDHSMTEPAKKTYWSKSGTQIMQKIL